MSVSPRALRLKLQGRLLLLCFGAALPILTVFALSLSEQFHLLQTERQQADKAMVFALSNSLENWGAKHFSDIKLISRQSMTDQNLSPDFFGQFTKRNQFVEIYRLFPDGKIISYYPTNAALKSSLPAKQIYDLNAQANRTSIFVASPLSGKNQLLIISSADGQPTSLPKATSVLPTTPPPVTTAKAALNTTVPLTDRTVAQPSKAAYKNDSVPKPKISKIEAIKAKMAKAKLARTKAIQARAVRAARRKHRAHQPYKKQSLATTTPAKISNKPDLAGSKLVVALDPKAIVKILATSQQNMFGDSTGAAIFSTLAIADSTKNIFAYVSEGNNSAKSQVEKYIPSLGVYVIANRGGVRLDNPINAWLMQTLVLALIAILGSCYLVFIASKHFTKQIKLLVKEVLSLGRGDFSKRLEVNSQDELGKLAKAINKIASRMQLDQEHRHMEEKISLAIRQSLDLDQVLVATVTELGKALEASRCCLALVDPSRTNDSKDNRELIFDYTWYDETKSGAPLINRSLTVEENGVMSMIIEQGSILSLDVLDEDGPTPLFENGKIAPEDWRSIHSLIACPITSAEGTIGLILIQQCDRKRSWSDKEIELVEVVTRQLTVAMQHAHLFYYTRTMAEQETLINHIVRSVRSSLDLDTILNTVTRELCAAIRADRCQILQPDTTGPLVVSHEYCVEGLEPTIGINLYAQELDFSPSESEAVFTRGNFLLGIDLEQLSMHGNAVSAETIKANQPYDPWLVAVISNTATDAKACAFKYFLLSSASKSLIVAPLLNKNRIIGLLVVHQCDAVRTWRSGEIQLVAAIADQLALAVTQASLFAQVKYQAITDGLTGLYNHVYFQKRLAEEIKVADRKGLPCSLLMLDLDLLKQINDKYGHPVGDAAIRQVAVALKTLLRSGDTAARYGGEEFAIILPETSLLEAALIGDRLCTHIANANVPGLGQITVSVGAASYPRQAKDASELISKADQALYEAKRSGRNQIWISESISDKALRADQIVPEFRVTRRLALAGYRKEEEALDVQKQTRAE